MADIQVKDGKVKDALDNVRASTQALHAALSDAAAKRGGALKADLQAIPDKAQAVADSLKGSMGAQNDATKKALADAVTYLQATQQHAAESLKSSGQAFQTSVKQTLSDARAAAQKVTEAVAAKRSAEAAKTRR
jgi:fructose-specific phosphotransferase system component IIB